MSNKPRIMATCKAGCKWETVHKADVLNMGTFIPVVKESGAYNLNRLDEYRIYQNPAATDWEIMIHTYLENEAGNIQAVTLPLPAYDKYTNYLDFRLLDFRSIPEEVTSVELVDVKSSLTTNSSGNILLDPNLEGIKYRIHSDSDTEWSFKIRIPHYDSEGNGFVSTIPLGRFSSGFVDFRVVSYISEEDGTYTFTYEINGTSKTCTDYQVDSIYIEGTCGDIFKVVETTSTVENTYEYIYEINGEQMSHEISYPVFKDYVNYVSLTAKVTGAERVYFYNDGLNTTCVLYELKAEDGVIKLVGSDGSETSVTGGGGSGDISALEAAIKDNESDIGRIDNNLLATIDRVTALENALKALEIYDGEISTDSLITFTVDGITFEAVEGMTWEEFVNSDYNTGGFNFNGMFADHVHTNTANVYVFNESTSSFVVKTDLIVEGEPYIEQSRSTGGY